MIHIYAILKFSEVWIEIYIQNEWGHLVMSFLCDLFHFYLPFQKL